jgi:dUTP pyrophosphatase
MKIKFKKLSENAILPSSPRLGDAGVDLIAARIERETRGIMTYYTDVAVEIPEGYVGLLFQRSSVYKTDLYLRNAVGVIDSSYRGNITVKFKNDGHFFYGVGDKIAQLVIVPYVQVEVEEGELSDSVRGDAGFGSTGN